jgi:hypothetical protein
MNTDVTDMCKKRDMGIGGDKEIANRCPEGTRDKKLNKNKSTA